MAIEVDGHPVNYNAVPGTSELMVRAAEDWVERGIIDPGDFLWAVVTNDLKRAVLVADNENIRLLPEWVQWFHWHVPGNCWGSVEIAREWAEARVAEREGEQG